MESKDDFVDKYKSYYGSGDDTLSDCIDSYNFYIKSYDEFMAKKNMYDKRLSDDSECDPFQFSFKEQWDLYQIVDKCLCKKQNGKDFYPNVDLEGLKRKIRSLYSDVNDCLSTLASLNFYRRGIEDITTEYISFSALKGDHFSKYCTGGRHFFIRLDDELRCVCCGATTKDYGLSKEELDFLTLCADNQALLVKEATLEDMPFINVFWMRRDYYDSIRKPLSDPISDAEERYLHDEGTIVELRSDIKRAHALDSKRYVSEEFRVARPKYLTDEETKKLLLSVKKSLEEAKKSKSRFRDLMIEECKTAEYEILILSGGHIPTLLEQAKDENDKIALTKAYYNLSDIRFKESSEYFHLNNFDAASYDCLTANPEINNRVLQMSLKRNNRQD